MAAINHTPVYQFNQWEAGDPVLREDFNADNLKMEAALNTKTGLELGSYTGTATANGGSQTIELGYRPKFIFVWRVRIESASGKDDIAAGRAVAADGFPYGGVLEITETGFIASNLVQGGYQYFPQLNTHDVTYYYAAFR